MPAPLRTADLARPVIPARQRKGSGATDSAAVFTPHAVRRTLRARMVGAGAPMLQGWVPEQRIVGRLTHAPDVAESWVYGLFVTVLGRLPDPQGSETFAGMIRGGSSPHDVLRALLDSPEAAQSGATAPDDLESAYVMGVYLLGLGRMPDKDGLSAHRTALSAGAISHQQMLDGILGSAEAKTQLRFPPAAGSAMKEGSLAARMAPPASDFSRTPITQLAKDVLRRRRGVKSAARELLSSSPAARSMTGRTGLQIESLVTEWERGRDWQWKVDRQTLEHLDTIAVLLHGVTARLDKVERDLAALRDEGKNGR